MTVGEPTADSMEISSYNKLSLWKTRPYIILEVCPNNIVVDENGIHSTVSIHQVSHAPKTTPNDREDTTDTLKGHAVKPEDKLSIDRKNEQRREYAVERIIGYYD